MRVWFYARLSEPFSPLTVAQRGLGGSESALYYVARGLAKLGHEVMVINHCGSEAGEYEGVRYVDLRAHADQWRKQARRQPPMCWCCSVGCWMWRCLSLPGFGYSGPMTFRVSPETIREPDSADTWRYAGAK